MASIWTENAGSFMTNVAAYTHAARKEPGCRQFEALFDPEDRTEIMLFEIYDDVRA